MAELGGGEVVAGEAVVVSAEYGLVTVGRAAPEVDVPYAAGKDAIDELGFGGVGFVTIPELSRTRFERVTDVVRIGQRVRGEVLVFDATNGEARLSLRALQPDPFQSFADDVEVGHLRRLLLSRNPDPRAMIH